MTETPIQLEAYPARRSEECLDLREMPAPISAARGFVRSLLTMRGNGPAVEEAVWTASELLTAAVGHQMADITLVVDVADEMIGIELRDSHQRLLVVEDEPLCATILDP